MEAAEAAMEKLTRYEEEEKKAKVESDEGRQNWVEDGTGSSLGFPWAYIHIPIIFFLHN